jgi:hypothetical protein
MFVKFDQRGTFFFTGHANFSDGVQVYVGGDNAWHVQKYSGGDTFTAIIPDLSAWHCFELEIDGAASAARAWFDTQGPFAVSISGGTLPYDFTAFVLSAPQMLTGWLDDFVIDTTRIGCP